MSKLSKLKRETLRTHVEYCYVCMLALDHVTGRVLVKPTKQTAERTSVPFAERRATMCSACAATMIASGEYVAAEPTPARLQG